MEEKMEKVEKKILLLVDEVSEDKIGERELWLQKKFETAGLTCLLFAKKMFKQWTPASVFDLIFDLVVFLSPDSERPEMMAVEIEQLRNRFANNQQPKILVVAWSGLIKAKEDLAERSNLGVEFSVVKDEHGLDFDKLFGEIKMLINPKKGR